MAIVVVGADGSPGARAATAWAAVYVGARGDEVLLIHVMRGAWELDALQMDSAKLRVRMEQLLDGEWSEALRDAGVAFRSDVVEGAPATELRRIAEEVGADLIAVGHTGHSGIGELILGGTTHRLLVRPGCPVVVVPAPPEE